MIFRKSGYDDLPKGEEFDHIMQSILIDGYKVEDYANYIRSVDCFEIYEKGVYCGFYTLELLYPNYYEIHLYVNQSQRKHSIDIMRQIRKETKGVITTTVSTDYAHVVRCLKMIGFKEFHHEKGVMIKNGIPYDLIYLESKE